MTPKDIDRVLRIGFGDRVIEVSSGSWQVDREGLRLLVVLSDDQSWLMSLVPIAASQEAQPFFEALLKANFEQTEETRYAVHEGVLWGVYRHELESLSEATFQGAIARLINLQNLGLTPYFEQQIHSQLRTIIRVSKAQGQTLEGTLQTLHRFYEEGLMGDLSQNQEERERILRAWQTQLSLLWPEIDP